MSIASPSTARPDQHEIVYPASDGQPMGETGLHVLAILQLFQAFLEHLPATDFPAADMFWYWEEGHPESCVAPDLMVVKGVGRAHRRSFFTWREGGAIPCIVFEMASENTWRDDLGEKRLKYQRLGVREYILFDPEGEYLRPRLQGFRLVEGRYEPIALDAEGRLRSEELGFVLVPQGIFLRLLDETTGALLPAGLERAVAGELDTQQTELRAQQAELRAQQAELRAQQAELRAQQERLHADQERLRAEQERSRADALAAEVERLKALLEQSRGGAG
jgi:Uma2 family endonuclease